MKLIVLLCIGALWASSQTPPPGTIVPIIVRPGVPAILVSHLELTSEQVSRIDQLNSSLREFEAGKSARSVQVQNELRTETARETVDPMALGLRYMELEAIRRQIDAERNRTLAAIQAVLTPAQRTRVAALQDILRMQALACEALNQNLVSQLPPVDSSGGIASFLLGRTAGCPVYNPYAIRTGDFTAGPILP